MGSVSQNPTGIKIIRETWIETSDTGRCWNNIVLMLMQNGNERKRNKHENSREQKCEVRATI